MPRRSRLSLPFLPQQKTTFTAKTAVNVVAGPYLIASAGVYISGVVAAAVTIPGTVKGQVR